MERDGRLITENPVNGSLAMGVWANMNEFVPKRQRIRFKSLDELERKIALWPMKRASIPTRLFRFT